MSNLRQAQSMRIPHVYRQIDNIIYGSHQEIIEGVQFDFCHDRFDVENWELPPALFKFRELFSEGPRLSFPWTELSEITYSQQAGPFAEQGWEDKGEYKEIIVEAGDKLSVSRIEFIQNKDLLRGCNLERRHVYMNLKRKNGDIIQIERPIMMTPKNELWENKFAGNYYSAIKGRIKSHFKVGDITEVENIQSDDSFAYRALRKLKLLLHFHGIGGQEVMSTSQAIVVLPICSPEEYHDNSNVWLTINDAVALGYLWAKSEDERNWVPFDDSKVSQVSAAGRLSAAKRGEDAEKWKRVLRAIVEEVSTSATKKLTRTKMVEIITNDRERWDTTRKRLNLPNAAMPGVHSLRAEVSKAMRVLERNEGKDG
jgi:hypothetical protein